VDFRYDVAVGDQVIDPAELAELARLKVPLVRLRGQWVELDEAHLKAALKFLERQQAGTMTAADALLAGLGLAQGGPGADVPLVGVDAAGWLGDLLSSATTWSPASWPSWSWLRWASPWSSCSAR
jgi:hypothetical protein